MDGAFFLNPNFHVGASQHREAFSALDIVYNEYDVTIAIAIDNFHALKAAYHTSRSSGIGMTDPVFKARIMEIEPHLGKFDVDGLLQRSNFDYWLAEGWKNPNWNEFPHFIFQDLLTYNLCYVFLNRVLPNRHPVAATLLFVFFSWIERSVDQIDTSLASERNLLTLSGSEVGNPDPVLSEGKLSFDVLR